MKLTGGERIREAREVQPTLKKVFLKARGKSMNRKGKGNSGNAGDITACRRPGPDVGVNLSRSGDLSHSLWETSPRFSSEQALRSK